MKPHKSNKKDLVELDIIIIQKRFFLILRIQICIRGINQKHFQISYTPIPRNNAPPSQYVHKINVKRPPLYVPPFDKLFSTSSSSKAGKV
eukprot:UN17284